MNWNHEDLAKILKEGGVVVMPTDTIYGIVGSALNKNTVERIYQLRKRNPEKPCIILISSMEELPKFSIYLTDKQEAELLNLWPGPISVILDCKEESLGYLHRGTNTLAFRVPEKENLIELLKKTGPLVAPSANIEGMLPSHNIEEAKIYFGEAIDFYMDGGNVDARSSKVVRLGSDGALAVLRE